MCMYVCVYVYVQMLASQALDIVGVQEVRFEAGDHTHNQIATLARFLPHHQV